MTLEAKLKRPVDAKYVRDFLRDIGVECLDDITYKMAHGYESFWKSSGAKKTGKCLKVDNVKKRLIELGSFSIKLKEYNEKIKKKIIEKILYSSSQFNSYYMNKSLKEHTWNDNFKIIFDWFKKSRGIEHLDDITAKVNQGCKNVWDIIDVKKTGKNIKTDDVKSRFVELGLFSPKIQDYDEEVKKKIIDKILNPPGAKFNSYYINKSLKKEIWYDNIKLIFDELKKKEKIEHLDDLNNKDTNTYCSFLIRIGVKKNKKKTKYFLLLNDVKNRLVELGLFSPAISDYDKKTRKKIIKSALKSYGSYSYYASNSLDKKIWYDNIRIVFDELKKKEKIEHLDDINKIIEKYYGFCVKIGVKKSRHNFSVDAVKTKLVELKFFSPKIRDYNKKIKKKIIEKILKNYSSRTYYFDKSLEKDVLDDNFKIIFNEFKKRERIEHLDDITAKIAQGYSGYCNIVGVKKKEHGFLVNDVKSRFVELGLFSPKIQDYDEEVKKKIIDKILNPPGAKFNSYYINKSLKKEIWYDNIKLIFDELKKKEKIEHLDDIAIEPILKYDFFLNSIGVKKTKSYFLVYDIKNRLAELNLFSTEIRDYDKIIKEKIIESILNHRTKSFKSYYVNKHLKEDVLKDNIKIILNELKERENIKHLDDIIGKIVKKYVGFWSDISVRKDKTIPLVYDVKTRLIHLGFFDKDVENSYSYVRVNGTALDLLKKLDRDLFSYKDVRYDDNKVDKSSYLVFKKLYKESKQEGIKLNNALELFEYYNKRYENGKSRS